LNLAIDAQAAGKSTSMMQIPLNDSDIMFVQGLPDRVTAIISTKFDEPSDAVLGRVFLQVQSSKPCSHH